MATVKIKGIPEVKESLRKLFNEVKKDPKVLTEIGVRSVELTQGFNRAGKEPTGDRHKPISAGWINRKEKLKSVNPVSEYYRKAASNLTFTGQLLRSIKFKVFSDRGEVELRVDGKRKQYKNLDGSLMDGPATNEELSGYLKEQGRFVFGGRNELASQIKNNIVKIVRTALNVKIRKSVFRSRKD